MRSATRSALVSLALLFLSVSLVPSSNATPLARSQGDQRGPPPQFGSQQRRNRPHFHGGPAPTGPQPGPPAPLTTDPTVPGPPDVNASPPPGDASTPIPTSTDLPPTPSVDTNSPTSSSTDSSPSPTASDALGDLSSATLPDGADGLAGPSSGLTLKAVAIGTGTQNYTCDTTNGTSVPVAIGALASLFDASSVISPQDAFNGMTAAALGGSPPGLPQIGEHHFEGATPTFHVASMLFAGGKLGNAAAPAGSVPGSVDWLKLGDNGASIGLKEAYRVETAGGKAPSSCDNQPDNIEVQYAAQYWFYG